MESIVCDVFAVWYELQSVDDPENTLPAPTLRWATANISSGRESTAHISGISSLENFG
jgi:hypothetical protein